MKIQIDGVVLADAVKTLRAVVGGATTYIEVTPNFMKMTSVGDGSSFMISVPIKILEKSKNRSVALDSIAFATSLTKVKDVVFEFGASSLVIKSGRYKADLITHQFEQQVVIPEGEKDKGIKIKAKFIDKIKGLVPKLELTPLLPTYQFVPFGVKLTKDKAFLASFDFYQAAFVSTKEITGAVEFVMPNNVFSLLTRELKGQDYQLVITESVIYAYNEVFEYAAPMPQAGQADQVSFDDMQALYANLKTRIVKEGIDIKVKTEAITQMMENGRAVYERDSSFEFTVTGDKCKLELKSSVGKISNTIMLDERVKKDVSFVCDFHFFSSMMKKVSGTTLTLTVIPGAMLLFKSKPAIYMMTLS